MHRWHLLRWRGWQLALHKIWRSDDDRALHDHRSDNLSVILKGAYLEVLDPSKPRKYRGPGGARVVFRKAETPHRLELPWGPVWTLWLRWPPHREWGFHCPKGWRHWKEYVAEKDYNVPGSTSTVGRGCD
jgi:hypothetical protein